MLLLIIDTATLPAHVRLCRNNEVIGQQSFLTERAIGVKLISTIDKLIKEQGIAWTDIDRIAVHGGPGAHSSRLRVGVTVGSILSLATGAELVSIDGEDEEKAVKQAMEKPAEAAIKIKYKGRGYGESQDRGVGENR